MASRFELVHVGPLVSGLQTPHAYGDVLIIIVRQCLGGIYGI